jgi:hypothetical protein
VLQVSQPVSQPCLPNRPFILLKRPCLAQGSSQAEPHPPQVGAGLQTGAGAQQTGAGLQTGAGAQAGAQQSDFAKRPFNREKRPGLEHGSSHAVAHPPPQEEPVETTAGAGAGAAAAGAASAPAAQAEVSMNNAAFTFSNLR